jgi:hypothetical protein
MNSFIPCFPSGAVHGSETVGQRHCGFIVEDDCGYQTKTETEIIKNTKIEKEANPPPSVLRPIFDKSASR